MSEYPELQQLTNTLNGVIANADLRRFQELISESFTWTGGGDTISAKDTVGLERLLNRYAEATFPTNLGAEVSDTTAEISLGGGFPPEEHSTVSILRTDVWHREDTWLLYSIDMIVDVTVHGNTGKSPGR